MTLLRGTMAAMNLCRSRKRAVEALRHDWPDTNSYAPDYSGDDD